MAKRGKLEIIKDILDIIQGNKNQVKRTPLLRKSNMSSARFKEYFNDLLRRGFIIEIYQKKTKYISLTEKGKRFLEKYQTIVHFIEEFEI